MDDRPTIDLSLDEIESTAMQKSRWNGLRDSPAALTGRPVPPILFVYVPPVRNRGYVLLLLSDAGVWVGTSEILPTHPAKRVGLMSSAF